MSITIRIKSKILCFNHLNDDCNYELNQYGVVCIINYINWSISELKILNKASLINWEIYSIHDHFFEIEKFEAFAEFINLNTYLQSVENKYKNINLKIIEKIYAIADHSTILKYRISKNKAFYFGNVDFLKRFRSHFDAYNLEDVLKYITSEEILEIYMDLIPLSFFDIILSKMQISSISCKNIILRFSYYPHEQEQISKRIFATQVLNFNFITQNTWSHDVWKIILQHQTFSHEELLGLLQKNNNMRYLISRYATLNEEFITTNLSLLDIEALVEFQELSYNFVKNHKQLIKFDLLTTNNKIKFTILQTTASSNIDEVRYVVLENAIKSDVVFF